MKRFELICNFDDFRKKVLKWYAPGWWEYPTQQKLEEAEKAWDTKNLHTSGPWYELPKHYPCIVEFIQLDTDNPELETWDNGKRYEILYRDQLEAFRDLFKE